MRFFKQVLMERPLFVFYSVESTHIILDCFVATNTRTSDIIIFFGTTCIYTEAGKPEDDFVVAFLPHTLKGI